MQHESVHVGAVSAVLQLLEMQSSFLVQLAPKPPLPLPCTPVQLKKLSGDDKKPFSMHVSGTPSIDPQPGFPDELQQGCTQFPLPVPVMSRHRSLSQRELVLQSELPA